MKELGKIFTLIFSSFKILKQIYTAIVESILNYYIFARGCASSNIKIAKLPEGYHKNYLGKLHKVKFNNYA